MHLTEITPTPCLVCGQGNTRHGDGSPRDFVDLEVDTTWDDPAMICDDCGLKIAGMLGCPSPELVRGFKQDIKDLRKEIHDLKAERSSMQRRAKKLGITFVEAAA